MYIHLTNYGDRLLQFTYTAAHTPHHNTTINTPLPSLTRTHTHLSRYMQKKASKQQLWSASTALLAASLQINPSVLHRNKWDVIQPRGEREGGGDNGPPPAVCHRAVRKPGSKTYSKTGRQAGETLSVMKNNQPTLSVYLQLGPYPRVSRGFNHFYSVWYHTGSDQDFLIL